eukprot:6176135-Pleurochrysis_carterae.AAC.1
MSTDIVFLRPERVIISISTQLNTEVYRLNSDQGWEPYNAAKYNRNLSVASFISIISTVDRLAIDQPSELGADDQLCILPRRKEHS